MSYLKASSFIVVRLINWFCLGAEKVIYHSEKFDPKFFLARIHQNTSAYDLEAAGDALKRDLQNRKEQLKKLVKENFDCFISCKNTIDGEHTGFILHHLMSSY